MPSYAEPIVDHWYYHLDKGQRFLVVAIDEQAGTIEIQHFDGDLDELSLEDWYRQEIETSEAPANWSGAADIAEPDDLGTGITDTRPEDWSEPQQEFRPPDREKLTPEPEEPADDFAEGYKEEDQWEGE